MAIRPKLKDWISKRNSGLINAQGSQQEYLYRALNIRSPGQWSANQYELSRHFTSAAYLAINTLANQAAASTWKVMQETPDPNDGDEELPPYDPLVKIFKYPNEDDSIGDLSYQISQQISLTGVALLWTPKVKSNVPNEFYVIPTVSALPMMPSNSLPQGSYQIFPYTPYGTFTTGPTYQSTAGARIPADQIIKIKNHHPQLRYDGYAVLTALRRQIDTIEGIDLARWNTQLKGLDPTMLFEFDKEFYDPKKHDIIKIREQLESVYQGPMGKKLMIAPPGMKASGVSLSPSEMAWQEGWNQLVDFVLAAYGTPKAVAGLQDGLTYATLYSALKQFRIFALNPLNQKVSSKLTRGYLHTYFDKSLYLKIEGQSIADEELVLKKIATVGNLGVMKKDEIRKELGYSPLGSPEGDELVYTGKLRDPNPTENELTPPSNPLSEGSLPPRKMLSGDRLATLLEKHKTNGSIKSHV